MVGGNCTSAAEGVVRWLKVVGLCPPGFYQQSAYETHTFFIEDQWEVYRLAWQVMMWEDNAPWYDSTFCFQPSAFCLIGDVVG